MKETIKEKQVSSMYTAPVFRNKSIRFIRLYIENNPLPLHHLTFRALTLEYARLFRPMYEPTCIAILYSFTDVREIFTDINNVLKECLYSLCILHCCNH